MKNELFVFGGSTDEYKIAKLVGCEFKEIEIKLLRHFRANTGTIQTSADHSEVFICFSWAVGMCQIFDGTSVVESSYRATHDHKYGCMGLYEDYIIAIGGYAGQKVEIYRPSGWENSIGIGFKSFQM